MAATLIVFLPEFGFLTTLMFGFLLTRKRKPYNGILFNIHKLVALGTVIVTSMQVYASIKTLPPHPLIVPWLVIAAISILALFVSGAFLSIGERNYELLKTVHNIAPVVVVIATGMTIFFL
jgi:DNA-binding helix-hairpin-helix protein with protein kinase domain